VIVGDQNNFHDENSYKFMLNLGCNEFGGIYSNAGQQTASNEI
jgi:hypothetical protein